MLKPLTHNICPVVRTDDINIALFMSKCKIQIFFSGLYALIWQWSSNLPIAKIQEINSLHIMETLGPLISSITLLQDEYLF